MGCALGATPRQISDGLMASRLGAFVGSFAFQTPILAACQTTAFWKDRMQISVAAVTAEAAHTFGESFERIDWSASPHVVYLQYATAKDLFIY